MNKKCSKCLEFKELIGFYKDLQKIDGLTSSCRDCLKKQRKLRLDEPGQKDKFREINRNSQSKRRKNPEVKLAEKEYRNERYKSDETYRIKCIQAASLWRTNKRKIDPSVRAIDNAKRRLNAFFKENGRKFSRGFGCDRKTLKTYIETRFKPGMSWENYGDWHIDHVYPLSIAIKETKESFIKACHYTNLQPLWASENMKKGNKLPINNNL